MRIALFGIAKMGIDDLFGVDFGLCLVDPTGSLEPPDEERLLGSDEPIPGWHWRPVIEQRGITHDNRFARGVAYDNLKVALWRSTEQFRYSCAIFGSCRIRK